MKHEIWQNINLDENDWKEGYREWATEGGYEEGEEPVSLFEFMLDNNNDYLDDERANLDVDVGEEIVVFADLGLWFGRAKSMKCTGKTNISDMLFTDCDYADWYVEDGDFQCKVIHHDGTNHYWYRKWKSELREEMRDFIYTKIHMGGGWTRDDMEKYTESLAPEVCAVYGWCA